MPQCPFLRKLTIWSAVSLLCLGIGASTARAQNATIATILPLGNDTTTTAMAMGANGSIVTGQSATTAATEPYVWTAGNGTVAINAGNATTVAPTAVNDANGTPTVVGSALDGGIPSPFVYDVNSGNFTALPLNSGIQAAGAVAISDAGVVAVNGVNSTNVTVSNGFLYLPQGNGTYNVFSLAGLGAISDLSNDASAFAYLNTAGTVAAAIGYTAVNTPAKIAPTLGGNYSYTEVDALSPNGRFEVGVATNTATAGQTIKRGYIFDSSSGNATLLSPFNLNDNYMTCETVSNEADFGPIAGGSSGASSTNKIAVLFDTGLNATLDLKQLLLDLYTLDVSNLTTVGNTTYGFSRLSAVHAISKDGLTIAGDGIYGANNGVGGVQTGFVVKLDFLPEEAANLTIVAQPVATTANISTNATFVVTAVPGLGGSAPEYQWYSGNLTNATLIQNANTNQLLVIGVTNTTTYFCNITNNITVAPVPSDVVKLTVNGKLPGIKVLSPKVKNGIYNTTVNGNISMYATTSGGTTASTYQWFLNGKSLGAATTSANYTLAKAKSTSSGNYTVTINSNFGNLTSQPQLINVLFPPSITTQPTTVTVMAGSQAQLSVVATGNPPPTYQWYIHNRAITNRPSAKLRVFNIPVTHIPDGNMYRVRVTNSQGFVYSSFANITVTPFNGGGSGNTTSGGNNSGGFNGGSN